MKNFVRILGVILLLSSTVFFILKLWYPIPIQHKYLFGIFIVGAISLMWANFRDKSADKNK